MLVVPLDTDILVLTCFFRDERVIPAPFDNHLGIIARSTGR